MNGRSRDVATVGVLAALGGVNLTRQKGSISYDAVGRCPIPIAPQKSEPHGRSEPRKKTSRKGRRS